MVNTVMNNHCKTPWHIYISKCEKGLESKIEAFAKFFKSSELLKI
jgi:hypothetical protein